MRGALLLPCPFVAACAGAGPRGAEVRAADRCASDDECTFVLVPCCMPCAQGSVDDVEAVLVTRADERRAARCPEPTPCPRCVAFPPSASLRAVCRAGACVAIDDDAR